jgi:hypothetical protein
LFGFDEFTYCLPVDDVERRLKSDGSRAEQTEERSMIFCVSLVRIQ